MVKDSDSMAKIKTITVTVDFYRQFEELNKKLDELIKENRKLRSEFKREREELKDTIANLETTIQSKEETIQKLLNEIDRLKNQNNKNSNNSSKPSSTNIVTPKKKTGANLYNYRTITGKKKGGQYNHQGYNLSKKDAEKLISENKVEVREIIHTIKGNQKKEPLIKYRYELEIKPYIEKHIFKYDDKSSEKLPKEFLYRCDIWK